MLFVTDRQHKMENHGASAWDTVRVTDYARLTENPLRKLTQGVKIEPNPDKKVITLQLGNLYNKKSVLYLILF